MLSARVDVGRAADTWDVRRRRAVFGCPISDLAGLVPAPAFHRAGGEKRAGERPARRYRSDARAEAENVDGNGARDERPVPERPAVTVVAPALRRPGARRGACVQAASRRGGDAFAEPGDGHRHACACLGAVAQLAVCVVAPARGSPVRHGAAVPVTPTDRGDAVIEADDLVWTGSVAPLASRADLAILVVTPAFDRAAGRQRARVIAARSNLGDAIREPDHADGDEAMMQRAVAELSHGVVAPALDSAGDRDCARVLIARNDLDCAPPKRGSRRGRHEKGRDECCAPGQLSRS